MRKLRKVLEVLFMIAIVAASVAIFIFKDRIGQIAEWGYIGVFIFCFLANATVFLPAPSLMIAASCSLIMNPFWVAVMAALGSSVGEFVGYAFGNIGNELSPKMQKLTEKISARVRNKTIFVFILALLPLPLFDAAGVYSGSAKMKLWKFFLACFVGKFIKMLIYSRAYDFLEIMTDFLPFKA